MADNELKIILSLEDGQYKGRIAEAGRAVDGLGDKFQKNTKQGSLAFTELNSVLELVSKGARAFESALNSTFKALDRGQKVNEISTAFNTLSGSADLASKTLATLTQETGGVITKLDLMQAANNAIAKGLPIDTVAKYSGEIVKLGEALGKGELESLNLFIQGTSALAERQLRGLGIIVDSKSAFEEYAKSVSKAAEDLTEAEKKTAFFNAALDELKRKSDQIPDSQLNAADASEVFRVSLQDLAAELFQNFTSSEDLKDAFIDLNNELKNVDVESLAKSLGNLISFVVRSTEGILELTKALLFLNNNAFKEDFSGYINQITEAGTGVEVFKKNTEALARALEQTQGAQEIAKEGLQEANEKLKERLELEGSFVGRLKANADAMKKGGVSTDELREKSEAYQVELSRLEQKQAAIAQAIKLTTESHKRENSALDNTIFNSKKATDALKKLQEQYIDLKNESNIDSIADALEQAFLTGNTEAIEKYKQLLFEATRDAMVEGSGASSAAIIEQAAENAKIAAEKGAIEIEKKALETNKKISEDLQREQDAAYRESVGFFEDIFRGAVDGNMSNVLKNMLVSAAVKFGAELAAQLALALVGKEVTSFLSGGSSVLSALSGGSALLSGGSAVAAGGNSLGGAAVAGGGAAAGSSALAAFASGPALPLAIAAIIAHKTGGFDSKAHTLQTLALGPLPLALGIDFGSGKSESQKDRDRERKRLIEAGLIDENFVFTGAATQTNIGTSNLPGGADIEKPFGGFKFAAEGTSIANTLAQVGGSQDPKAFAELFQNAIANAESFNEVLLNGKILLDDMGISAEAGKDQLKELFLNGTLGAEEFAIGIQNLNQLATAELGSIDEAFQLLARTIDGPPKQALKAFELLITEAKQIGIDNMSELSSYIGDRLGPDAKAVFERMSQAGIDFSFNVKDASADAVFAASSSLTDLQNVFLDVFASGQDGANSFAGSLGKLADAARKAKDAVDRVPSRGAGGGGGSSQEASTGGSSGVPGGRPAGPKPYDDNRPLNISSL